MLIQRGKSEGWLHLDPPSTQAWAVASGVAFVNAYPGASMVSSSTGLLARQDLKSEPCRPVELLTIDANLVLSLEAVKKHAQFDMDFRQFLDCLGDFARTPRGAILSFLLFQASVSCPHLPDRVGVHCPFTDYVKSLPCELLPTFWRPSELNLLTGTTLAPAVSSKLKSLRREYDLICERAAHTRWFQLVASLLDFEDWMHVDAMFRSRALDFYGSCMIPGMDLANHAAGDRTNAYYDRGEGTYHLWLMDDKEIKQGEEVYITYGDEKGACEMLFSYGFLEEQMESAETLFLSLDIPESDSCRLAKRKIANCAPGFKLMDISAQSDGDENSDKAIDWSGDFIWLLCVDQDDGLEFKLARTVDGADEEIQATFKGQELMEGASELRRQLAQSDLWDVYRLRAIVILQQRVFDQLQTLFSTQEDVEATPHGDTEDVRATPYQLALTLRRLEFELLDKAYEDFERQKLSLANSSTVQKYLAAMQTDLALPEEDFS